MAETAGQTASDLDRQIQEKRNALATAADQAETLGKEIQALEEQKSKIPAAAAAAAAATPAPNGDVVTVLVLENQRLNNEVTRLTGELAAEKAKNASPVPNVSQNEDNGPKKDSWLNRQVKSLWEVPGGNKTSGAKQ